MSRIFISYARTDVEFARRLACSLSEMGAEVWLDVNDIPAGMKWSAAIQEGLNICQVMLLIISPESMASNNVEDEWQYFLDEKKLIIPLWYRPTKKHFQINRLQHVDFHEVAYDSAFDHLLKELQGKGISVDAVNTNAAPSKPSSISLMPAPFAWIDIPHKGYSIAKYPVTNAQFAKFIEADGYNQQKWWTDAGWEAKRKGWDWDNKTKEWVATNQAWTEPRYWTDKKWNSAEQPIVGVSWYEAVAFCQWLTKTTGEQILLPTEDQWQYAAQSDDERAYPWGDEWNCKRCNNSVEPCGSNVTTPVRHYEGKGDSPFGVVDMAGNVREWCLTNFDDKRNDVNSASDRRVQRGGSWYYNDIVDFRCDHRIADFPINCVSNIGFRISRFN